MKKRTEDQGPPTIIYAVASGEYSDYRVNALFSTEKNAEAYIKAYKGKDDDARIESYPLDPVIATLREGLFGFRVEMSRDGKVNRIERDDEAIAKRGKTESWAVGEWKYFYVVARNKKHAVKIAGEKRAKMIALGQWQESYGSDASD